MFDGMVGYGWRRSERRNREPLLRQPEPVWLDLAMVFPVPEDAPITEQHARDVHSEVPAEVDMRDVSTTGHPLLHVRYDAPLLDGSLPQGVAYVRESQWVLAWCVRPRDDGQPLLDVRASPSRSHS